MFSSSNVSYSGDKTITKTDQGDYTLALSLDKFSYTNTNINPSFAFAKDDEGNAIQDVSLTINKADITDTSVITVTLGNLEYTYDKSAHKVSVTVKDAKGNEIAQSGNYTITGTQEATNVKLDADGNVTSYTFKITGTGNYTGEKEVT